MKNRCGRKLTRFSIRFYRDDGTFVSEIVDYFLDSKEAWKCGNKIKKKGQYFNVSKA